MTEERQDAEPESSVATRWFAPLILVWAGVLLSVWVFTKKLDEPAQVITPKVVIAFLGVPMFSLLLLVVLRIVAKRASSQYSRSGDLLILWVLLFLFLLHASVLSAAIEMIPLVKAVPLSTALLLCGVGPLLMTLEPGSAMGLRTKATLASPEIWKKTHKLAAKLFIAAGLLGLSSLFYSGRWVMFAAIVPACVAVVAAIVYAARLPVPEAVEDVEPEERPTEEAEEAEEAEEQPQEGAEEEPEG